MMDAEDLSLSLAMTRCGLIPRWKRLTRCSRLAIIFLGCGLTCSAQIAKEIPRGTTADVAIQAYGWPRGRAVSGGREIWTYDTFQVTFENGRVENVSALPPSRSNNRSGSGTPVRVQPGQQPPGALRTLPVLPKPTAQPTRNAVAPSRPGSMPVIRSSAPIRQAATSATTTRVPPRAGLFSQLVTVFWPVLVLLGLAAALGPLIVRRNERRRRSIAGEAAGVDLAQAPKDWTENVGEKLAKAWQPSNPAEPPVLPRPNLSKYSAGSSHGRTGSDGAAAELTPTLLRELEWKRFELVVVRYFSATGVRAELTCTGADGGVDAYLYRAGENRPFSYVQCKAYAPGKYVDVEKVRALFGAMSAAKIEAGVFVTTSKFGPAAVTFAQANNIETIDGEAFVRRFAALPEAAQREILAEVTAGDYTTPTCPSHEVKMVHRTNGNDGSCFWGCPRPRCRRTINIRTSEG